MLLICNQWRCGSDTLNYIYLIKNKYNIQRD